jgi:hypothetical protein
MFKTEDSHEHVYRIHMVLVRQGVVLGRIIRSLLSHHRNSVVFVVLIATQSSMAAYFFASPVDVDIKLEGEDIRKQVDVKQEKERTIACPVYYDGDSIGGTVCSICSRSFDFPPSRAM